jgi:MoaA/NifB/PqqE/SkfB family radical SAM enzyme
MVKIKGMSITFGYSCNNNCIHCIIGEDVRKAYPDRTTEEIKRCLKEAIEKKYEQVIFIGGEVTIRDDFFELLKFAKLNGLHVHIESNARMFYLESFAKKTLEIDPDLSMMVSFHSPIKRVQDMITRANGSFEQTVRGIKNLKKYGLKKLATDTVITKFNYTQLPALIKFFKRLGVDESHLTLMRIGGNASKYFHLVYVPFEYIKPYLYKAIEIGEKIGIEVKTYGFPYCWLGKFKKHASELDFIQTYLEGKAFIFDEPRKRIDWQKERIAIKSKTKECKSCSYFFFCEGIWQEYIGKERLFPIAEEKIKNLKFLNGEK